MNCIGCFQIPSSQKLLKNLWLGLCKTMTQLEQQTSNAVKWQTKDLVLYLLVRRITERNERKTLLKIVEKKSVRKKLYKMRKNMNGMKKMKLSYSSCCLRMQMSLKLVNKEKLRYFTFSSLTLFPPLRFSSIQLHTFTHFTLYYALFTWK